MTFFFCFPATPQGETASSGPQRLKGSAFHNDFEQGKTDDFELPLPPLGRLTQLEVWHDNSGEWQRPPVRNTACTPRGGHMPPAMA